MKSSETNGSIEKGLLVTTLDVRDKIGNGTRMGDQALLLI